MRTRTLGHPAEPAEQPPGSSKGQPSRTTLDPDLNLQYRICFVWTDAGAEDVEIVDYH